ncbi:carbon storage regulator CsrA [Aporhodopirellula aestuarii]|uniref:Translational regulator CsrA n=1 Tax=Aporhodopirellula aestuarii TaxID=2950107 RepID=A0ABT0TYZ2_9BACT|nr:carbon storage regulator CsrA [Aporhodopirellula aestuarii]MCM2369458.1 carbon storage regulator CsrA [Aporhodopirellula aestuarii]
MLVLSRKTDESIVINENVTVVILSVQGGKVRLGIEAPKEVPIMRQEIANNANQNDPSTTQPQSWSAELD